MEFKRINDHIVIQHHKPDQNMGKQQRKPWLMTIIVLLTTVLAMFLLLGKISPVFVVNFSTGPCGEAGKGEGTQPENAATKAWAASQGAQARNIIMIMQGMRNTHHDREESIESWVQDSSDRKVDLPLKFSRTPDPGNDAAAFPYDLYDSSNSLADLQQVTPNGEGQPARKVCMTSIDSHTVVIPCKAETLGPRVLPAETSIIETTRLPTIYNHLPEIGNGHVATVIQHDTIFMNGLYNGANDTSHRARIPSTAAVFASVISPGGDTKQTYRLDLGRGVFSEEYAGDGFTLEVRRYAHRSLTRLLVTDVTVTRTTSTLPIILSYYVNSGPVSQDISFVQENPGIWNGMTKVPEFPQLHGTIPVTVVYSVVPLNQTFAPGTEGTVTFLTSVSVSREDAVNAYAEGVARLRQGTLFSSHVAEWDALWQRGHLELSGDVSLAITTNAAQYYLFTALPFQVDAKWPFFGMAPGGLAHGGKDKDYFGHLFWDQDAWMFPPIALLHADIGRILVGARIRTFKSAQMNANMSGWSGALYPTESGFTGLEVDPSRPTAVYEIHGTGDVSWAMRQYMQLTNDTDFLSEGGGYEALANIADYWVSRSVYNQTRGVREIKVVMGPDELNWPVNNSVYTNGVAVDSMRTAQFAARLAGRTPDPVWEEVASTMLINYDSDLDYHPEFDNYKIGTNVKQADMVMLIYPHKWNMSDSTRRNDLIYYASVTPGGPAMTWSVFTISWLRLGNLLEAAYSFDKGIQNVQQPFRVWAEIASGGGAYNFHTGMGGYLQSLIFGYMGVDMNDLHLDMEPRLPPSLTAMTLTGLDYMGSSLDVAFDAHIMNITMTKAAAPLTLLLKKDGRKVDLKVGSTVSAHPQAAQLFLSNV